MKSIRRILTLPVLAVCGVLAACSSAPAPDPDLASRLEADTGVKWTVYRDPRTQEVRFAAPEKPVQIAGASPEEKARGFFSRYAKALATDGNDIELTFEQTDRRGGKHLRFRHKVGGTDIPALDVGTTAHFTQDGAVTWLEIAFRGDLGKVAAKPQLSKDEAVDKALAHVRASCGAIAVDPKSDDIELGASVMEEGPSRLVYRVGVTVSSESCGSPAVLVDAKDGSIVSLEERRHAIDVAAGGSRFQLAGDAKDVKTISVTSTSDASGPRYQMISEAPVGQRVFTRDAKTGNVLETRFSTEWDISSNARGAAVDAHFNVTHALPFLRDLDHTSLEDRRHGPLVQDLQVSVHLTNAGKPVSNAFGGSSGGVDSVLFGDGDLTQDPDYLPFSAAFDAVAHELTHVITAHTSALAYHHESGALNESFSDVLGAAAEHAFAPDWSADHRNLLLGEGLFSKPATGWRRGTKATCVVNDQKVFRDMIQPENCKQPTHASSPLYKACGPHEVPAGGEGGNDSCGVHINSGIPNRVFSLMVSGGFVEDPVLSLDDDPKKPKKRIGVPGIIDWETATEIWYWAMTGLSADANFQNAARAQIAESMSKGTEAFQITSCAWYAVGVLFPSNVVDQWFVDNVCVDPAAPPPPDPTPTPTTPSGNECEGHGDNPVCSALIPNTAAGCKGGYYSGELFPCADIAQHCKPNSPTDPTATFDLDTNALVCE